MPEGPAHRAAASAGRAQRAGRGVRRRRGSRPWCPRGRPARSGPRARPRCPGRHGRSTARRWRTARPAPRRSAGTARRGPPPAPGGGAGPLRRRRPAGGGTATTLSYIFRRSARQGTSAASCSNSASAPLSQPGRRSIQAPAPSSVRRSSSERAEPQLVGLVEQGALEVRGHEASVLLNRKFVPFLDRVVRGFRYIDVFDTFMYRTGGRMPMEDREHPQARHPAPGPHPGPAARRRVRGVRGQGLRSGLHRGGLRGGRIQPGRLLLELRHPGRAVLRPVPGTRRPHRGPGGRRARPGRPPIWTCPPPWNASPRCSCSTSTGCW